MPSPRSSGSDLSLLPSSTAGSARRMSFARPHIEIHLKNHFQSKVYNTGSPIEGDVTIATQRDTRFDSVQIIFLGLTRTRVEGVGAPHTTTHTLLKLTMPIPESTYPVPRVLEAGRTYTIPFNFIVPSHLTIGACDHRVDADHVREHHLSLPPTMGFWEKDDMSPDMAKVEYCIKARVLRDADLEAWGIKVMEATEKIKVLPTATEQPPLNITKNDNLYKMSKSKTIRKNLLASRLGKVTVSAAQPSAIVLGPDGLRSSETTARVQLVWEPASADVPPPRVNSISGKITAHTFYSSIPNTGLPNISDPKSQFTTDRRSVYSSSVPLFSTQVSEEQAPWRQHLKNSARRDSGYSSAELDNGDGGGGRGGPPTRKQSKSLPVFHTCTVLVPVGLPRDPRRAGKTFIPSFHSCITSRVYTLSLSLALGSGSSSTTLSLSLPLQIAAEGGLQSPDAEPLPDFETAMEEAQADEHLRPRTLSVPDEQFRETSVLPGYA